MRTVAVFADRWILPGLHATIASLLSHARSSAPFRVVVFGEGLSSRERRLLARTAEPLLGAHDIEFKEFMVPLRGQVRSLRGNYTTYGRLFLPELLPDVEVCLYLDCDLIVARAVDELFDLAASGGTLYAEGSGVRRDSLDRPLFETQRMDLNGVYFNCGVLVLNLERWRREGIAQACLAFAAAHPDQLFSADQSVLNVVLADRCEYFGSEFNTLLWPTAEAVRPGERSGRIFHFVGAPKPWNYLGRHANFNHALWRDWAVQTAWWGDWKSRLHARLGLRQEARLSRATMRALMAKCRGATSA